MILCPKLLPHCVWYISRTGKAQFHNEGEFSIWIVHWHVVADDETLKGVTLIGKLNEATGAAIGL